VRQLIINSLLGLSVLVVLFEEHLLLLLEEELLVAGVLAGGHLLLEHLRRLLVLVDGLLGGLGAAQRLGSSGGSRPHVLELGLLARA
jgi:hypothetical protein